MPDTNMTCYSSMDEIPKKELRAPVLFFICDVIHHLSEQEWKKIKQEAVRQCEFIVIKDINCHYRFKNWMNKMHDRMINGEKIHDVDPDIIMVDLHRQGYKCLYKNIHKFWYSHFIILAVKQGKKGQMQNERTMEN